MTRKLIIESGATKSQWLLISVDGAAVRVELPGMNVSTMAMGEIEAIIAEGAASVGDFTVRSSVTEIYLYTAGVIDAPRREALESAFRAQFPALTVLEMESDLLAAARAVCGHAPGIAVILGTGSNSCLFDGKEIVAHVNSGGFILGDEGSAARLGLKFAQDHIKGLVPAEVDADFCARFDGSYANIVANVYGRTGISSSPSAYLGAYAPFLMGWYDRSEYVRNLVDENFRDMFRRYVRRYNSDLPVGIVGGFGYACRDIISRIAAEEGVVISQFVKTPVDLLVS